MQQLWLLGALTVLSLSACSSQGGLRFSEENYRTEAGKALVFVLRRDEFASARTPSVQVGALPAIALYNYGYAALFLMPGTYHIKAEWPSPTDLRPAENSFAFEASRTYYVRVGAHETSSKAVVTVVPTNPVIFLFSGDTSVSLMEPKEALNILRQSTSVLESPES